MWYLAMMGVPLHIGSPGRPQDVACMLDSALIIAVVMRAVYHNVLQASPC